MNKHKTIFAFAIALLSLVYTPGFCAELIGLVEEKETGVIDWANGTVQAKGVSAPLEVGAGKSPTNNPKALSEAKNDARRKLLEAVKRIQIASKLSVGDVADRNKTVMTQIKEMVYDAAEIEKSRKYMSDGSVEVSLQMNLHGGFAQLILPKEIRQIETIKQLKPEEKSSAVTPISSSEGASNIFTGLIVDARGTRAIPALVPKLLDENLAEVFGPAFVSREFVVQQGMTAYYTDIQTAKTDPRISDHPLIVKALRTDWPNRCSIVISNADASKLKSASDHLVFLKESRVVIVLSPP
ncbi:MAG: hypothetical protein PVI82_10870 [Desulfobacterales bacterium]|jgi:hypothetical protein